MVYTTVKFFCDRNCCQQYSVCPVMTSSSNRTAHQHIVHMKQLTFCAKKHRLYSAGPVASKQPRSESSRLWDLGCYAMSCLPDKNPYRSVDELKRRVTDVWCGLEQLTIDMAIDQWSRRLRACVRSKGGHFEHSLWPDDINFCQSPSLLVQFLFDCYRVNIFHGRYQRFSSPSCKYLSVRETNDATCRPNPQGSRSKTQETPL